MIRSQMDISPFNIHNITLHHNVKEVYKWNVRMDHSIIYPLLDDTVLSEKEGK